MPEGTVRLACIRHAASVRSEPGSNSQVISKSPSRPGNPEQESRPRRKAYQRSLLTKDTHTTASTSRRRLRIPPITNNVKKRILRRPTGPTDPLGVAEAGLYGRAENQVNSIRCCFFAGIERPNRGRPVRAARPCRYIEVWPPEPRREWQAIYDRIPT